MLPSLFFALFKSTVEGTWPSVPHGTWSGIQRSEASFPALERRGSGRTTTEGGSCRFTSLCRDSRVDSSASAGGECFFPFSPSVLFHPLLVRTRECLFVVFPISSRGPPTWSWSEDSRGPDPLLLYVTLSYSCFFPPPSTKKVLRCRGR